MHLNYFYSPLIKIGCVEDLLIKIINPKYKDYNVCFDDYIECIKKCIHPPVINLKSKLYAYNECTGQETNLLKVNFLDKQYWDLDHKALKPLKDFFQKCL